MEITREEAQAFEDAHAEGLHDGVAREGCPICESYRTKTGRMMTESEIQALSKEAEQGYEADELLLGEDFKWAAEEEARREFHHSIDQQWEDWSKLEGPRFFTEL